MAKAEAVRAAFNRGLIAQQALARVDLSRTALSAEEQTNFPPRSLGSTMLRPGLQYIWGTQSNAAARYIPFVRSLTAMYLLEFTAGALRIGVNTAGTDALLTRAAVSSALQNGTFTTNLANWTDSDEAGGVSAWLVGGYMSLIGNGTAAAIRDQTVAVAAADQGIEHALRIVVKRGPVTLRVGSTSVLDDYITETTLYTGVHSLAFTPGASFTVRFMSRLKREVLVDSCDIEAAGIVVLTTPFVAADLDSLRADTESLSVDVLFMACSGYTQRRIERRASGRSWSFVLYQSDSGPFMNGNTGPTTLTPSALSGNGTLTASVAFFRTTHAPNTTTGNGGTLFQLTSTGQTRTVTVTAQNQFSSAIRVTGTSTDRAFTINIDAVGAGTTIRLQRSLDSDTGPWTDVTGKSWTAATAESFNDTLDNQIVWYRIGCKTGEYGVGTSVCVISTSFGSIVGIARVTAYTSSTVVSIEILAEFGATTATDDWAEGLWSDYRGWPSAGTIYEGRMNWDGMDKILLSESDEFDGFDQDAEGDAGPINRSIGSGPMETINWALPLQRLVLGAALAEHSVRSNAFDEPITPTNFNRKPCSTQGSANVQAVKVDTRGFYVQRGGSRVFELSFDPETYDYASSDATILNPELGDSRFVRLGVQRQPDTRVHAVRADGTVAMLVHDKAEKVLCWIEVESIAYTTAGVVRATGLIEDIVVLPGASGSKEDQVYYVVKRTVNSATVRYLEKWAKESEGQGTALNKQADSFITYTGAASNTITGLTHLVGEEVVVWGNSKDLGRYTVSGSGEIMLTEAATNVVVGLHYRARFKSAKLGQTLSKTMLVERIAPILRNTHAQGLQIGQTFEKLSHLPLVYQGTAVDTDRIYTEYDEQSQAVYGTWSEDARVCMEANAPRPCNVMALKLSGQAT